MKLFYNDEETAFFELSTIRENVIKNDINEDDFEADMQRRLNWVITNKYEGCFSRLKAEWDAKLTENGITSIPTDPDEYATLVFSQSNYKSRKQCDEEATEGV